MITIPAPPDSLIVKADEHFAALAAGEQLIEDETAQAFVDEILGELLAAGRYDPTPFSVHLQNSLTINAAMYANGRMILTSGLLLRLNSREELSSVMAHELSHYVLPHFRQFPPSDAQTAEQRSFATEYQADSMGMAIMLAADLPASAAVDALDKLPPDANSLSLFGQRISLSRQAATHPPVRQRIERLRQQAAIDGQSESTSKGAYHSHLAALRENARYETLNAAGPFDQTLKIITLDSLIGNLPDGDTSQYYYYLRFQQAEAIVQLYRGNSNSASVDLQRGLAVTTYRHTKDSTSSPYYSVSINDLLGGNGFKEVYRLFIARLEANLRELSQTSTYRTEAMRLKGHYLYAQGQYADAHVIFTEYLADKPTHPGRRYVRSLLSRMPTKNKKTLKY